MKIIYSIIWMIETRYHHPIIHHHHLNNCLFNIIHIHVYSIFFIYILYLPTTCILLWRRENSWRGGDLLPLLCLLLACPICLSSSSLGGEEEGGGGMPTAGGRGKCILYLPFIAGTFPHHLEGRKEGEGSGGRPASASFYLPFYLPWGGGGPSPLYHSHSSMPICPSAMEKGEEIPSGGNCMCG